MGSPSNTPCISRAIENAQAKVEGHNFDIRKQLLEYDDVMNQQREVIYRQRREALEGKDLKASILDLIAEKAEDIAFTYVNEKLPAEEWDLKGLSEAVFKQFNFHLKPFDADFLGTLTGDGLADFITEEVARQYDARRPASGASRCARSSGSSCSRPWTISGRITSSAWII